MEERQFKEGPIQSGQGGCQVLGEPAYGFTHEGPLEASWEVDMQPSQSPENENTLAKASCHSILDLYSLHYLK